MENKEALENYGYNMDTDYLFDWVDMYKGMTFAARENASLIAITRQLPEHKEIGMRYKIPVSANKIREIKGIIKAGEYQGKELIISVYEGEASQGAQSGFKHVPHLWLRISGGGWDKPEFKRFSGKNIAVAQEQLEKIKSELIIN